MKRSGSLTVRLHRWFGLGLAALIFLSAATGAAMAWRDHVWRLQHPSLAAPVSELTDAELARQLSDLLERHPRGTLRLLAPPREGLAGWQAWFDNGDRALYSAEGRLLARWNEAVSPFGILHALHVDLLAGAAGRWLMGAVGAGALILTLFGVWAWLRAPRRIQARHLAPARLRRGPWLLAHRQWGLLVALPTVLLMLTGTIMNWSAWWRSALPAPEIFAAADDGTPHLRKAISTLRAQWPGARIAFINTSQIEAGRLQARLRQPGEIHPNGRSSVTVTMGGELLERYDARRAGAVGVLDDLTYPVHSGRIDVPGWHLTIVISGVVIALLSVSGWLTWLAGRARRPQASVERTLSRVAPRA